jgi:hypothetical protein
MPAAATGALLASDLSVPSTDIAADSSAKARKGAPSRSLVVTDATVPVKKLTPEEEITAIEQEFYHQAMLAKAKAAGATRASPLSQAALLAETESFREALIDAAHKAGTSRGSEIGTMYQERKVIVSPWYLDVRTLGLLQTAYPFVHFQAAPKQRRHDHPFLNIERSWCEEEAYKLIKHLLDLKGIKLSPTKMVVDVGGNPHRHRKMKRVFVHSTNPVLSSADVVRSYMHTGATNTCSCRAEMCACVSPAAYLSVDSLYYLSLDTVAQLVEKSEAKLLVAVTHLFPNAYGSFAGGEATYQLTGPDEVTMSVRGNSHSYTHSAMLHLRSSGHHYRTETGEYKTLCWSQQMSFQNHVVYVFTTTSKQVSLEMPINNTLSPALQSQGYYGPISIGSAFSDRSTIEIVGDVISLPHVSLFSWGTSVIVYESSRDLHMLCPKGLIDEAALWSMGRDRTKDLWKSLLAWLRFKTNGYNIPPGCLDMSVFAAAAIGFTRNIAYETGVMHSIVAPLLPTITAHTNAMSFQFQAVWTWKRAAVAIMAGATAVGVASTGVGAVFGVAAGLYTAATAITAAGITVGAKLSGPSGLSRGVEPAEKEMQFIAYRATRASNPARTAVVHITPGTRLPATEPVVPAALAAAPLAPGASVTIRDETTTREVDGHGPLVPAGIVSTMCIPVVPANSAASSVAAIQSRIVKLSPYDKGLCSDKFIDLFEQWIFSGKNLEEMGLAPKSVIPMTFEGWNSTYPLHVQRANVKALEALNIGNFHDNLVNERGEFVKIELLSKSSTDGVASLAPRAIQSGTPIHNVCTGPSMKAFSKRLAAVWNVTASSHLGPKYTSGATAEEIGKLFATAVSGLDGSLGILEGDFARFDSTIHRRLLELEARVYKYLGVSERAIHAILSGVYTRGRDKWGNKYKTDGGRHSGDHNTSCGNTLLQGLAILFCCAFYESTLTGKIPTATELCAKYKLTLLLLGDDNLCLGDNSFLSKVPLKDLLLKLGLELEPKYHTGPTAPARASFCSARFWPTASGETILVSGPGRSLSKSGYLVNPPPNIPLESIARGDALGRARDSAAIPFSRLYWNRVIELTSGHKAVATRLTQREVMYGTHSTAKHEPCDASYAMTEALYGLTRAHEQEYAALLQQVKSLPCVVDYAPLQRAMIVDGVLAGEDVSDGHPLETTPEMDDTTLVVGMQDCFKQVSNIGVPCLHCSSTIGVCGHLHSPPSVLPTTRSETEADTHATVSDEIAPCMMGHF